MHASQTSAILVAQFRRFYREVHQIERALTRAGRGGAPGPWPAGAWQVDPWQADDLQADGLQTDVWRIDTWQVEALSPAPPHAPPHPPLSGPAPDLGPAQIRQRLLDALERAAADMGRGSTRVAEDIRQHALYAMAALADEIFLELDWRGRAIWADQLLESDLFRSHRAGEELFRRVDTLLQSNDPVDMALAPVYLMVLSLGFQGKLRGTPQGPSELERYRTALFRASFGRPPELPARGDALVPQTYACTLDQGTQAWLPYLRRWLMALGAVVVLWIVLSFPLWHGATAQLDEVLERLEGKVRTLDGIQGGALSAPAAAPAETKPAAAAPPNTTPPEVQR
jgi:type VI secretion system protein ImpK